MLGKRTPLKRLKRFTKKASDVPRPTRKRKAHEDLDIDLENEFENGEQPLDIEAGNLPVFGLRWKELNVCQILIWNFYLQLWRL